MFGSKGRKERKRLEPEKLVKWNKTERKRNEKQDKMLKNKLTSHPKLRIIETEWGAFGKRSAHQIIRR